MTSLHPLGDRAFLARFATEDAARAWADAVSASALPGVIEVTLAYATAAIYFDPDLADPVDIEAHLRSVRPAPGTPARGRLIEIPVLYDGDDLAEVARRLDLSEGQVIEEHAASPYTVFAVGFLPGFPYAGYLPETLTGLPRRERPRARVPAGSVAIAGRQTGIYPQDSPGGWLILGRTPLVIVDLKLGIFPITAGDQIKFESIDHKTFENMKEKFLFPHRKFPENDLAIS